MSIVDQLIENAGVYLGIGKEPAEDQDRADGQAARIVIAALPNEAGVTVDYETFNPATPERVQPHIEHAVIGRLHSGGAIMVTGHSHAGTVAVLRETDKGHFEMGDEPAAFPMAITISFPERGRLVYVWSYAEPGGQPIPRDRAELIRRS